MRSKIEEVIEHFSQGCNCAQALLMTYGAEQGLKPETGFNLAAGFGGGVCLSGHICGDVTGALMVVGLQHSNQAKQKDEQSAEINKACKLFLEEFKKRNGSIICKELIGCSIYTPEAFSEAEKSGVFQNKCVGYIKDAAEIIEQTIIT